MPIPYGITCCLPLTKTVRWVWTWTTVCSLVWHCTPSMVCPFAALSSVASFGPLARPTVSGPGDSAGGCTQLAFMDAGIGWRDDPRWGLENDAGGPLEP